MRKVLRRAGWTLLTAGSVGLASPGLAQLPVPMSAGGPAPTHQVPSAVAPPGDTDAYHKTVETKVELTWLANPATFPYRLAAHVDGGSLEVRGSVPNEAVREEALKLARQECPLNVVDALKLQPNLALRPTGRPVEELQSAATHALAEDFPQDAKGFDVKAQANGQVAVHGTVPSLEEKLLVSRRLHRVNGCTCVVNQLQVTTPTVGAPPHAAVSAASEWSVPADAHQGETRHARPAQTAAEEAPRPRTQPAVETPAPAPAAPPAATQPVPLEIINLQPASRTGAPVVSTPAPAVAPKQLATPTASGTVTLKWSSSPPLSGADPQHAVVTETSGPVRPAVPALPVKPVDSTSPKPTPSGLTLPSSSAPTSRPPAAVTPGPAPTSRATVTAPPTTAATQSTASIGAPYVTTGVVLFETSDPEAVPSAAKAPIQPTAKAQPPAKHAAQPTSRPAVTTTAKPAETVLARAEVQRATTSATPAVTKPTVQAAPKPALSAPATPKSPPAPTLPSPPRTVTTPPAKPATAKSAASPEQVRLKQRIETVCGKAARDVEVLPSAGKDLTVRLKTRTTADGQRVSNLVLRLPELTPYRVTLDVQVVP